LIPTYPLSHLSYNSLQYRPQPRRRHHTFIAGTALSCHHRRSSSSSPHCPLVKITRTIAPPWPLERVVFATHSCRHAPSFVVLQARRPRSSQSSTVAPPLPQLTSRCPLSRTSVRRSQKFSDLGFVPDLLLLTALKL